MPPVGSFLQDPPRIGNQWDSDPYSTGETIVPIRHVGSDDEKKGGTKKNDTVSLF